jgi:hypothetical protein
MAITERSLANLIPGQPHVGWLTKAIFNVLDVHGSASTSEITSKVYAVQLAFERLHSPSKPATKRKPDRAACVRCALKSIGAIKLDRAKTRGRPWRWTLPVAKPVANDE